MTDPKKPPPLPPGARLPSGTYAPLPKTASGHFPAVQAYRLKLESISEHNEEAMKELEANIAAMKRRAATIPPPSMEEEIDKVLEELDDKDPITLRDPNAKEDE